MSYTPKPYTGALFENDRKEQDAHPDWRGYIMLADGRKLWVSGWKKISKDNKPFISVVLNEAA